MEWVFRLNRPNHWNWFWVWLLRQVMLPPMVQRPRARPARLLLVGGAGDDFKTCRVRAG